MEKPGEEWLGEMPCFIWAGSVLYWTSVLVKRHHVQAIRWFISELGTTWWPKTPHVDTGCEGNCGAEEWGLLMGAAGISWNSWLVPESQKGCSLGSSWNQGVEVVQGGHGQWVANLWCFRKGEFLDWGRWKCTLSVSWKARFWRLSKRHAYIPGRGCWSSQEHSYTVAWCQVWMTFALRCWRLWTLLGFHGWHASSVSYGGGKQDLTDRGGDSHFQKEGPEDVP